MAMPGIGRSEFPGSPAGRLKDMRQPSTNRRGYALVWVILTVAIIAALVATAAPMLATINDRERATRTATDLRAIAVGFFFFEQNVGRYPGNVSQLTNTLRTTNRNSCRLLMTSADTVKWLANGPFVSFYVGPNGRYTDIGRIRDSVPARTAPGGTSPIFVEIPAVNANDAAMLDLVVDGDTGDTVTYTAPVNDTTTVRYRLIPSSFIDNNTC
jgi:hypothetical protein